MRQCGEISGSKTPRIKTGEVSASQSSIAWRIIIKAYQRISFAALKSRKCGRKQHFHVKQRKAAGVIGMRIAEEGEMASENDIEQKKGAGEI